MTDKPYDALVEAYVELRDKRDRVLERHKEELQPYAEAMRTMESAMATALQNLGAQSVKTPHGTFYQATWEKVVVQDWQVVLDYAVEHGRLDIFERRVNKSVALELEGDLPGIVVERGVRINVRRS